MGGILFVAYAVRYMARVRGDFCTPCSPFLSSNWMFVSHSVMFGHIGPCTSWGLLDPMRSFDPLNVLSCPVRFFYRTEFLCPHGVFMSPWCLYAPMVSFMPCEDSFSWSLFWLQVVFVPHGTFYGPCGSAVSLGDFLKLLCTLGPYVPSNGVCTLGIFFPVVRLATPRDLLCPRCSAKHK